MKLTQLKNKGFYGLMIIYILLMIMDIYSTLKNGSVVAGILEANPIVHFMGFGGLIGLNIAFVVFFWWVYHKRNSPNLNFLIVTVMFFMILTRLWVVKNNLAISDMNLTVEQATAMATPENIQKTREIFAASLGLPIISTLIPYFIWRMDHEAKQK